MARTALFDSGAPRRTSICYQRNAMCQAAEAHIVQIHSPAYPVQGGVLPDQATVKETGEEQISKERELLQCTWRLGPKPVNAHNRKEGQSDDIQNWQKQGTVPCWGCSF